VFSFVMLFTVIESHEACSMYSTASVRLQVYNTDRSCIMQFLFLHDFALM